MSIGLPDGGVCLGAGRLTLRQLLTGTTALLPAMLVTPAMAQTAPQAPVPAEEQVEEIVVTGSLIVRDGYEAPTPVTVLGIDEIQQHAPASIADYVHNLPAMGGGNTTHQAGGGISNSTKGTNTLNLRGLGNSRTLVLIDGVRLPPVSFDGTTDISGIPESLVSRVDVVTGGASAAYGSDAVAGVVNFVLDTKFTGIRGELQGGITTYGDAPSFNFKLTGGFPIVGGRGHVLLSGDYAYVHGQFDNTREWAKTGWINMANPAYTPTNGQPQFLITGGVGNARQTYGGIINAGPLKGIYFGPGGTPAMLNYGPINNGTYMIGGDWEYTNFQLETGLDLRNTRPGLFFHTSYDLTDNVEVYAEASWSRSNVLFKCCNNFTSTSLSIRSDNAFIPAEVRARMTALNLATITIGTENGDLGATYSTSERTFNRYRVGLNTTIDLLGSEWNWGIHGQAGYSRASTHLPGVFDRVKYAQAYDAVRHPTTGAIVCRSTLTSPNDGCVPFNIMGEGVNSQAAINYVTGESYLYQPYAQTSVGTSFSGEPFEAWAGPVSIAAGVDYRRDSVKGVTDPISPTTGYFAGNYRATTGSFDVIEGFAETVFPLAKDEPWARQLDLNGAVRAISYSQAGYVTTWKAGLTYNPTDEIRIRLTRSRDIRAPNLSELFAGGGAAAIVIIDPFLNNINYGTSTGTFGNPNLVPEKADTTGTGIVYQPEWLPGFSTSFDFYNIDLKDAISTVGAQAALYRCFDGESQFCPAFVRDTTSGQITLFRGSPFNFATEHTSGFDVEATYRTTLDEFVSSWAGDLTFRVLATHVITDKTDDGAGTVIENAGDMDGAGPLKWRANVSITYSNDALTLGISERIVSSGVYSNNYVVCTSGCPASTTLNQTVNYNTIKGAAYTDVNFSYKLGESATTQVFVAIQNLFDKDPPPVAAAQYTYPANPRFHDIMGRQFRAGVRFTM